MNLKLLLSHYRSNAFRLRQAARKIRLCHFYRTLGYGWRDSWGKAARTI
jgi:hypothetical protein